MCICQATCVCCSFENRLPCLFHSARATASSTAEFGRRERKVETRTRGIETDDAEQMNQMTQQNKLKKQSSLPRCYSGNWNLLEIITLYNR